MTTGFRQLKTIKSCTHTQAALMSLFLFVISLILIFLASTIIKLSWSENIISFVNNILLGVATGLIGIIFTISFVQSVLDKQAEKVNES